MKLIAIVIFLVNVSIVNAMPEIHFHAKNGRVEKVKELLDKDPNLVNSTTKTGDTPLHWAIRTGRKAVVDVLLQHGANVTAVNNYENTCLHVAAESGRPELVELMLRKGSDIHAKNKYADTPLHEAARTHSNEVIRVLIKAGANIDAENNSGHTPMDKAMSSRRFYEKSLNHDNTRDDLKKSILLYDTSIRILSHAGENNPVEPAYYVLKKVKGQDSESDKGKRGPQMDSRQGGMEAELERLNRPEARHERKLIRELQGALEEWVENNSQAVAEKCDLLIEQIVTQPKPSAKAYFTAAMAANLLGSPKKAILMLKKAIVEYPDAQVGGVVLPLKVTGYYPIGAIARQIGDANEATKAYELLIKNTQGLEGEEFRKADCYMYLAEIASEILKDKQLAMKRIQEMIATMETVDADKLHSSEVVGLAVLRDWASYKYARLKDGKAPVLDPSELDKAKFEGVYMVATVQMSLNGLNHPLLLEQVAQSNKSPIDSAFAKLTLAVIYSHQSNINPPKAERYLSSLAESDSYFAPCANMMLQTVHEEAKKIREKIPELLNDLKRGDKEKRKWAAFKLARESGPDGVKALHRAQEDPNKYVRYEAACTLARWGRGRSIKPDFNLILEALMDEDAYIREKARGAFSIRGPMKVGPKQITAIVSLMNDHHSKELYYTIVPLLSSVAPEEWKASVPELIKLLNHENTDVRTTVLDILRRMGPAASEAIPSLIKLLPYEDATRPDYIFAIIGRMKSAAEPFMMEIAKYLDHKDINIRQAATNTLKRISPEKAEKIFEAREKEKLR